MSVDTEIQGRPGQVEGVADWLRNQLASTLGHAGDRLNEARRSADGSWNSDAGDDFVGVMARARDKTDDLHSAAKKMAEALDAFASSLRRCQNEMADVRAKAHGSGLTVSGFVVQDPGPGPERPPDLFEGTPQQVEQHHQGVDAYNTHQRLLEAYDDARREAARVDRQYAAACRALQDEYTVGKQAAWLLNVTQVLGSSAASGLAEHIKQQKSRLHTRAQSLVDDAKRAIDDLQANPERYMKRKWLFLRELDEGKLRADRLAIAGKLDDAQDLVDRASKLDDARVPKFLARTGRVLGPAGMALGVYNDYQGGETTAQIAASQGGSAALGVAAAAGTGAAVGATVGSVIPVAGTAVGAGVGTVVGAGVAIFSDGAIDSLFENGPDAGKAFDEGLNALESTGSAITDGVSGAADSVGGWFS